MEALGHSSSAGHGMAPHWQWYLPCSIVLYSIAVVPNFDAERVLNNIAVLSAMKHVAILNICEYRLFV